MGLVVCHLDGAAALGLGDGALHAVRHLIRIHDDQTLRVAGGAANGLDQARLTAKEAFLVGIQDGNEADFRQVQTLAQQVDAHHHINGAEAEVLDDFHPLEGVHLVVHILDLDALFGQKIGQVFGHFLGQSRDEDPFIFRRAGVDLAQQVGHLALDRTH